jgi:hypothetical protein
MGHFATLDPPTTGERRFRHVYGSFRRSRPGRAVECAVMTQEADPAVHICEPRPRSNQIERSSQSWAIISAPSASPNPEAEPQLK